MARPKPITLVSLAGIIIVLIAITFSGSFGWFGFGELDNESDTEGSGFQPSSEPGSAPGVEPGNAAAADTLRPLRVAIRGREYFIAGARVDLEWVIDSARRVPAGEGPAVVVLRAESSRASAEESLGRLLKEKGILFEWREAAHAKDAGP